MLSDWIDPNVFAVCVLGIGGPLLGLAGLLVGRPGRPHRRVLGAVAVLLAALAAAAAAGGQPFAVWLAPAALAGICGLFLALGSLWLGHSCEWVLGLLRRP